VTARKLQWLELKRLADESGLRSPACHFSPGASKRTRLNTDCLQSLRTNDMASC